MRHTAFDELAGGLGERGPQLDVPVHLVADAAPHRASRPEPVRAYPVQVPQRAVAPAVDEHGDATCLRAERRAVDRSERHERGQGGGESPSQ